MVVLVYEYKRSYIYCTQKRARVESVESKKGYGLRFRGEERVCIRVVLLLLRGL